MLVRIEAMNPKFLAIPMVEPASTKNSGRPTVLEFVNGLQIELAKAAGLPVEHKTGCEQDRRPKWSLNIVDRLRRTNLQRLLKLRSAGEIRWQNYGKIIGVLERGKTFLLVDLPRIIVEEGLDKITDEQWEKIQPMEQLRWHVVKILNRTVSDGESLNELVDEVINRWIESLQKHRQVAFWHASQRSAKEYALFLKGVWQGYKLVMDEAGKFCGDRGRTEIYMELLSSQYEIEKMRRMLPARTDDDLYRHLEPWYKFPAPKENGRKWLRDVCDDICLYMKGGRGRPHKFLKPQSALSL